MGRAERSEYPRAGDMEEMRGYAFHLPHPHRGALAGLPSRRFLTWGTTRHMRKIRILRPAYSIRRRGLSRLNLKAVGGVRP